MMLNFSLAARRVLDIEPEAGGIAIGAPEAGEAKAS